MVLLAYYLILLLICALYLVAVYLSRANEKSPFVKTVNKILRSPFTWLTIYLIPSLPYGVLAPPVILLYLMEFPKGILWYFGAHRPSSFVIAVPYYILGAGLIYTIHRSRYWQIAVITLLTLFVLTAWGCQGMIKASPP